MSNVNRNENYLMLNSQYGFTLIELLVSVLIVGIISAMLVKALVETSSHSESVMQSMTLENSAQLLLDRLTKEIESIGLNTYYRDGNDPNFPTQPKILYLSPYQILFNSDQDQNYGPIKHDPNIIGDPNSLSCPGTDYCLPDPNAGSISQRLYGITRNYIKEANVPNYTVGAETIYIGLDSDFDAIPEFDPNGDDDSENVFWTSNDVWGGLSALLSNFKTPNPFDYPVIKATYGFVLDPNDPNALNNIRKVDVLGIGVHPWLPDANNSLAYPMNPLYPSLTPTGASPPPLFEYWGYWGAACSDPNEECLMGDSDQNGYLDEGEIDSWVSDSNHAPPGGFPLDIEKNLARIVINICVESPIPHRKPIKPLWLGDYNYDVRILSRTVVPFNLKLRGTNQD